MNPQETILLERSAETERATFLEVSEGIGGRLCVDAIWDGDACTWTTPGDVPSGPFFYGGTAGIAFFLQQLYRHSAEERLLRTAQGALRFALLAEDETEQATAGFYDGTGGIITVLLDMAQIASGGPWLNAAKNLGDKLARGVSHPGGFDLISGEAGSLLGLLRLHAVTGSAESLAAACELGDELLRQTRREPDGVSWDVMHPKVLRNLIGLSHGAGGIGITLLELYRWSGDARYLVTSCEALRYEDSVLQVDDDRWPDLRHSTLARYLEKGHQKQLVDDLLADRFEAAPPSQEMTAWCHGAPGIALLRARFAEVTGWDSLDDGLQRGRLQQGRLLQDRLQRAVQHTSEHLQQAVEGTTLPGHSLCHGVCGNADVLLTLGRRLGVDRWVETAFEVALRALEQLRTEDGSWRSGHPGQGPAPDLMRGEAGIGLFYLRCACEDVADCLLPMPTESPTRQVTYSEQHVEAAVRASTLAHFPLTSKALMASGVDFTSAEIDSSADLLPVLDDAVRTIRQGDSDLGERLEDLLGLEREVFEMFVGQQDFSKHYLTSLLRRRPEVLGQGDTLVCLAEGSRLRTVAHSWDSLAAARQPADVATTLRSIDKSATTYLLYTTDHRIRTRRLGVLAATMYGMLVEPIAVSTLYDRMVESLATNGLISTDDEASVAAVRSKLQQILHHAFRDEMIDIVEPYDLAPSDITGDLCIRCGECCKIKIEIPGDATYTEFAREMLQEPLRISYPEAEVKLVEGPGTAYTSVDLGYCRHLNRGTGSGGSPCLTCGIYEQRPLTCRQFNCVTWWRRQRLMATGPTTADGVIEKVVQLMGRSRKGEKAPAQGEK